MFDEAKRQVNAFLESYRAAFERFDATAIAEHFAYPLHITTDTGDGVRTTVALEPQWHDQIEQILDRYGSIGFSSARAHDTSMIELTPRVLQAFVHWTLLDSSGQRLYDLKSMYTLARIDATLRIVAIAHDELRTNRRQP